MLKNIRKLFFKNVGARQTIFKNVFWLAVSTVISSGVGFIIVIWLARHFGPAIYGQWAFALHYVALFSIFTTFGLNILTIREISRDKTKTAQYIDNIIAIKLILGLITLGLIAFIIQFLGKNPETVRLVYFLGLYIVISSFVIFFQSIFRANEKMQYETACYGLQSATLLGLVALFILKGDSIITISYAYIGASLVTVLFSLVSIWQRFSKFFLKIDFNVCKKLFSEAWPYGLSYVAVSIYCSIDSVMLGVIKSNQEVGWYSAAYKVVLFAQMFGLVVWRSFFPQLCQKYKESLESLKTIVKKFAKVMHFFAWPIAFGGTLLAGQIIIFFYGEEYLPGKLAFQILIWTTAIIFISSIYYEPIKAADRPKLYLIGVGVGAILNVILNFLLIPVWSLNGAAVATLLTNIAIMIFMYIQLNKLINIKIFSQAIVPLCSSIIMGILIYFYFIHFNVLLAIFLGALIYFLLYYIFSFFKKLLPVRNLLQNLLP